MGSQGMIQSIPVPQIKCDTIEEIMVHLDTLTYGKNRAIKSSDVAFIRDMAHLYQMERNYSTKQVEVCVRKIEQYVHLLEHVEYLQHYVDGCPHFVQDGCLRVERIGVVLM